MPHDVRQNIHRRVVYRRQAAQDPNNEDPNGDIVPPGGGSGPKFPPSNPGGGTGGSSAPATPPHTASPPNSAAPASSAPASAPAPSKPKPNQQNQPSVAATSASSSQQAAQTSAAVQTVSSGNGLSSSANVVVPTAAAVPVNSPAPSINYVYESVTPSADAAALSATSSPSNTPSSGSHVSTGIIVGGVAAAAVAVIGILFAIFYFIRKCRSEEDDILAEDWNADSARRQSRMIDDIEPTPPNMFAPTGGSLRPPTMIERHVNNASPMLAHQRSLGQQFDQQPNFDQYNGFPPNSYSGHPYGPTDGEFPSSAPPPMANPFASPYVQEPMGSPMSSTVPNYDSYPGAPMAPANAVSRQRSVGGVDGSYADLSRATGTPHQGQPYAEVPQSTSPLTQGAIAEGPTVPPAALMPGGPHAVGASTVAAPSSEHSQVVPRSQPPTGNDGKRPDTMYSAVYDNEDAYGGI